ncbi:MAG TPA: hypothetical protein VG722_10070 [Tepidisphaeraceae bacterium]|nr:hypothetical protein [Tepidisphaeraceae bacterium]
MKRIFIFAVVIVCLAAIGRAEKATTLPTTQPAVVPLQSDSILDRMLQPSSAAQPLEPEPAAAPVDASSGQAAVKPEGPKLPVKAEGSYIIGRLARFGPMVNGFRELVFDSDGQAMLDPPMLILPNQMLASMESEAKTSNDPMAFRVSGMVTQYKDRNYLLIDKAVPEPRK